MYSSSNRRAALILHSAQYKGFKHLNIGRMNARCPSFLTPSCGNSSTLSTPTNWKPDRVMPYLRYRFTVLVKLLSTAECWAILPPAEMGRLGFFLEEI